MVRIGIVVLSLAASIAACAKDPPPAAAANPEPAPAQTPAAETAKPTAQEQAEIDAAATAQESADDAAEPADRGDAGLERLAALPADQQLPNGRWKPGVHYNPLVPAQPTNVGAGEVEVVEVLWYSCPHCYALEPFMDRWDQSNEDYVKLVKMPVVWSPGHRPEARLFYALEALQRPDLHRKVFETIHQRRQRMVANSESATRQLHVDWAKAQGLDPKKFEQAYDSFAVSSNVARAERLTDAYRVGGTPLFVVNGKYATDVGMAGGEQQLLALLDDLAQSEKR